MTKLLIVLQLCCAIGIGYLVYKEQQYSLPSNVATASSMPSDFTVTNANMASDLMGQSVSLQQGQMWNFMKDQNLTVNVVSKKVSDSGAVVVLTELSANVKFPPQNEKDKKASALPKQAMLNGYARLFYEQIKDKWHLVHVEPTTLKITAE